MSNYFFSESQTRKYIKRQEDKVTKRLEKLKAAGFHVLDITNYPEGYRHPMWEVEGHIFLPDLEQWEDENGKPFYGLDAFIEFLSEENANVHSTTK